MRDHVKGDKGRTRQATLGPDLHEKAAPGAPWALRLTRMAVSYDDCRGPVRQYFLSCEHTLDDLNVGFGSLAREVYLRSNEPFFDVNGSNKWLADYR
jgi:hypothetical protein